MAEPLEALLQEGRTFPPPAALRKDATITDASAYADAERDWQGHWAQQALALDWIDESLAYNWVHTLNNAAIITTALLWGNNDYVQTLGTAVAPGRDTDSNGATVGSTFGALDGTSAIPAELVAQGHETVRSAVRGFDRTTIDNLTTRTLAARTAVSET